MTKPRQKLNRLLVMLSWSVLFPICALSDAASTPTVVLYLKSGDQISGFMVSENTNQVVISNAWVKALSIPVSVISSRGTNKMVKASPPIHPVGKGRKPLVRRARAVAASRPSIKAPTKSEGIWHGQINIGTSIILNSKQQQDYSGHAKFVYTKPYLANPKKFSRNTIQFGGAYQRTDNQESADRAHISNKTDFDLWDSVYAYGQAGAGYDRIQNIDFQYRVGSGGGFHVIKRPHFVLDTEVGTTYQDQYNRDAPDLQTLYARLAEDFTCEIWKNLRLTENMAFYPDFAHQGQYHNDFTSTLSYGLWKHLTLDLTVTDHFNTQLSAGTNPNEFDLRSSLGYMF